MKTRLIDLGRAPRRRAWILLALLPLVLPPAGAGTFGRALPGDAPTHGSPMVHAAPPALPPSIHAGSRRFATRLHRRIAARGGNRTFSPFSVSSAFAMLYRGVGQGTAAAPARTADEMQRVFGFPAGDSLHPEMGRLQADLRARSASALDPDGDELFLRVANKVYVQEGREFDPDFLESLVSTYMPDAEAGEDAPVESLDFEEGDLPALTDGINRWVERRTEEKIENLIPQGGLGKDTRLVLANALYMKGCYDAPFEGTFDAPFRVGGGGAEPRPMMSGFMDVHHSPAPGDRDDDRREYSLVELPLRDAAGNPADESDFGLVVLLPDERRGLAGLEEALDPEDVEARIRAARDAGKAEVEVTLPKFKVESTVELMDRLVEEGLETIWTDDADLTRMNPPAPDGERARDLKLSRAFHKAVVEVGERCLVASAATALAIADTRGGFGEEPVRFEVDRPFLFLVRYNPTGTWLFVGRITDPVPNQAATGGRPDEGNPSPWWPPWVPFVR